MFMHHSVHAMTLPEAYHRALNVLNTYGEIRPCPAWNTREKSVAITIDIAKPLAEPRISKLIPCDPYALQQYVMEMTEGIMDFEATITGNWSYTYHNRMIGDLIQCLKILKKDPYSRRAIVDIRKATDIASDDPPCLTIIQYLIENGYLNCFVTFRSNDAIKAFFMNAFALIEIQKQMADILGVKVGRYIHTANSFHAYEQDWPKLEGFNNRMCSISPDTVKTIDGFYINNLVLDYDSEDGWKPLMEDSIPQINQKVKRQMEKYGIPSYDYYYGKLSDLFEREMQNEN